VYGETNTPIFLTPYWVDQSSSQGVFLMKTLSKSCNEYEVDVGITFGYFLTYQGLILSHLWVPL
jgi:hypothetical protein